MMIPTHLHSQQFQGNKLQLGEKQGTQNNSLVKNTIFDLPALLSYTPFEDT